ncbi:MAG TPA: type II toxin-antitoxin system prevent-host-death family antitoxin [Stellaceae bacterium]|nr:type II toxin-antitoxin system prevent-host-death family antitoxin [Stellaceae bacterium]
MDDFIGAFDAKTHFSRLLERVAAGEAITITRHGTPVARLVPVKPTPSRERRREAVEGLKAFAKKHTLGGLEWKALRDEGRK